MNWSDESYRKMSTKISVWGTNGRISADRQECQVYLRSAGPKAPGYAEGWNVKYTTELTEEVWFYVRGEEYSAQLDHFAKQIAAGKGDDDCSFASAAETDRVLAMIRADADGLAGPGRPQPAAGQRRSFFNRLGVRAGA